jgi:DNA (cytosine-5)-methyltransferase 1
VHDIRIASFFSGTGMLDRGIHAAFERLGFRPRTVLWCEFNPDAQRILQARMRDGLLDTAPIWPDVRTMDGGLLRGGGDAVVAGFPCQDLSLAGKRAGLGECTRSGLFFDVLRIASDSGAQLIFLENVGGIVSAATSVQEDEPGDGDQERAISVVIGALSDAGFDAAWVPLRASDSGAPHGRLRWFCLGWRR